MVVIAPNDIDGNMPQVTSDVLAHAVLEAGGGGR
jgi:hypothetical protein